MAKRKAKYTKNIPIFNGFIYVFVNRLFHWFKYLNLVEGFKFVGIIISSGDKSKNIKYSRIAVDIFIVLKWIFISTLWFFKVNSNWLVIFVWYLLVTNLYTYFYYHSWANEILKDTKFDIDRVKRRFLNSILAFCFSIIGFAYLYSTPYSLQFSWGNGGATLLKSLWFSISNSLTASYDQVRPITDFGISISIIQLIMMFAFITIIIGGSIPQFNQNYKEEVNGIQE